MIDLLPQFPDHREIDFEDRGEIDYWTKVFDISRDELFAAVSEVGTSAQAVRNHLATKAGRNEA
jgi:hypothetical protein